MMFFLREARDRVGVHLRHDQRHVRVVAPGRGIVDHDARRRRRSSATIPSTPRRPPTSGRCRCRRSRNARAPCTFRVRSPKETSTPIAAARGQRHDLVGREFALVEDVEHFPPDIAGRADDCDFVTHRSLSEEKCRPRSSRAEREAAALLCEKHRQHNVTMVQRAVRCSPSPPTIRPILAIPAQSVPRDQLRRRSLRHGGAAVRLCRGSGAVRHPWRTCLGPVAGRADCRTCRRGRLERRRPFPSSLRPEPARCVR